MKVIFTRYNNKCHKNAPDHYNVVCFDRNSINIYFLNFIIVSNYEIPCKNAYSGRTNGEYPDWYTENDNR